MNTSATRPKSDEEHKETWYFVSNPQSKSEPGEVAFDIRNRHYIFATDSGVFSRSQVDPASRTLIKAVPSLRGRVLDFGCGYGVIGICLAKENPEARFELIDVNIRAVGLAAENILRSGCTNARAYESDGFNNIEGMFDAIVSNPPVHMGKAFLHTLFDTCRERLADGGALYAVFLRQQGAKSYMAFLQECFGNCEAIDKSGGVWVLRSEKPRQLEHNPA